MHLTSLLGGSEELHRKLSMPAQLLSNRKEASPSTPLSTPGWHLTGVGRKREQKTRSGGIRGGIRLKQRQQGAANVYTYVGPSWPQTQWVVEGGLEFLPVPPASTSQCRNDGSVSPLHPAETQCWESKTAHTRQVLYQLRCIPSLLWYTELLKGEVSVLLPT